MCLCGFPGDAWEQRIHGYQEHGSEVGAPDGKVSESIDGGSRDPGDHLSIFLPAKKNGREHHPGLCPAVVRSACLPGRVGDEACKDTAEYQGDFTGTAKDLPAALPVPDHGQVSFAFDGGACVCAEPVFHQVYFHPDRR